MSAAETRFEFGENWRSFLERLSEDRIAAAESSLTAMLGVASLSGRRFLDVGSGSGLFSLAARRLGAMVRSFDFDAGSVECTAALKAKYFPGDARWIVERGSILDAEYVDSLGLFDVVYAWGVLHHTGDLDRALDAAARAVAPGGRLFVSIYNDQGWVSGYWRRVKELYNRGAAARWILTFLHAPYLVGARWLVRAATGRRKLARGMSLWFDMKDWLGGYPFEVARPEEIVAFYRAYGFEVQRSKTCGRRHGCNEFVFVRSSRPTAR